MQRTHIVADRLRQALHLSRSSSSSAVNESMSSPTHPGGAMLTRPPVEWYNTPTPNRYAPQTAAPIHPDQLDAALDTLTRDALLSLVKGECRAPRVCSHMLCAEQRLKLSRHERRMRDLEDYIDALLARIMVTQPDILQQTPRIVSISACP
ncbi:unnamed protein product [Sphagnum balticum]